MNYLETAKRVFNDEITSLQTLSHKLDKSFDDACELLFQCKGKVVVCGMGKSGHIGNKIAATLASTGTSSFFMHPGEANHGDLGMLSEGDVLIGISNSGETSELIGLLPVVKRLNVPIIAITNKPNSSLANLADVSLNIHVESEACSLGLAPTTSTTATLVLGDALAIALLEAKGFTSDDFALSHPGGSLGKRLLLTVSDIMVSGEAIPLVSLTSSVTQALFEISEKGLGMTGIVNEDQALVGVFTDGDLRRSLDKKIDIHTAQVSEVMTESCITISADKLAVDALNLMQARKVNALLVTANNESKQAIGALKMHDLLKAGVV
jgi:arabinose-5-phosphate isomerase